MKKETKVTPLMQQYHTIKEQYPDTLIFFQVGDFYELFFDDAKKAAAYLGITLTKRGKQNGEPIPLCGVPVHALDHYLRKLVKGGFCVAICDQLEPPQPGRVVKRGITQVLTPGTLTDTKLLDQHSASYLFSFFECEGKWGLLFTELLTAQLYATVIPAGAHKILEAELNRFFPDEVLLADGATSYQTYFKKQGYFTSCVHTQSGMLDWAQQKFSAAEVTQLKEQQALCNSLDLLYGYVKKNNQAALDAFAQIHFYQPEDFLVLDPATQRNLELLKNLQDGGRINTLLATLDKATTAMGSRTLKKWLVRPLLNKKMIEYRFAVVGFLKENYAVLESLKKVLQQIGDGERIIGRIALNRGLLHDYLHLAIILAALPEIKKLLETGTPALLTMLGHSITNDPALHTLLVAALNDDNSKDWKIKQGFDKKLDHLRQMVNNSQAAVLALEQKEQEATGIGSLKIRFNNVHGYYLEVTKTHLDKVPEHYKRRQTLANRERYTFPELQQLESDIMTARTQIDAVELELFEHVKQQVVPYLSQLRKTMHALAQSDALLSFALCAYERGYVKPELTDSRDIVIKDGKHPVVEQKLGSKFIPNDTQLDDAASLWIVTGPNMGGKSTYLRQVAQLCIMAQCGSFIPAAAASLPTLDRIFTRIGASDNVAEGKSTFLVEMEETAHICQFATQNSLVILDEVGRGTSTFDGLAIAQAVIEYLFTHVKARCLFATHYHELTKLEQRFKGIASFYAASKKEQEGIVFLHKIIRGVADGSFGLEVAKLAHLPEVVVQRAYQVEQELSQTQPIAPATVSNDFELQQLETQLKKVKQQLNELTALDYDSLSPKKAFDLLWKLKEG
jgi:DNA mismatch repair protein MutS